MLYLKDLSIYLLAKLKLIPKIEINSFENLFIFNIGVNGIKSSYVVNTYHQKIYMLVKNQHAQLKIHHQK